MLDEAAPPARWGGIYRRVNVLVTDFLRASKRPSLSVKAAEKEEARHWLCAKIHPSFQ
jgi:hypothetical protein